MGLWDKVIWSRPLWMRGGEKFWCQSYVNLERFWNFYTLLNDEKCLKMLAVYAQVCTQAYGDLFSGVVS